MPAIVSEDVLFGPPSSLQFNGVELGASEDPAVVNITGERFEIDFQGASTFVAGLTRLRKVRASLTAKLNELSLAKLGWVLQNMTSTVGTAATTSNGHSQTLSADAAAGATVIKFPTGIALATSSEADDIIDTATAHGFTAGQRVMFESLTGGAGLTALTPYFVIAANLASTTLQVSLTLAGTPALFTTDITAGVLIPAYTAGEFLKIGDAGETEIGIIGTVGTAGSGGTGLTLTTPLVRAHDTGDAILQVANAGTTILRQRVGIIPATDHHNLVMQAVGPDGSPCIVTLFDAIATGDVSMTFGDNETAGTPITWSAYADEDDPGLAPYAIERLTV
jgi:hypothetical protein